MWWKKKQVIHVHHYTIVGYGGCGWYLLSCGCGEKEIG